MIPTIGRVAKELGEDEDWLCDVADGMDPEDGLIWVFGLGDDGVKAFTDFGIENLMEFIRIVWPRTRSESRLLVNPNVTALIAVCPAGPSRNGATTITAAINGAGCITLLPYDRVTIGAQSSAALGSPQSAMPSAWVCIASASSSALTILEWE